MDNKQDFFNHLYFSLKFGCMYDFFNITPVIDDVPSDIYCDRNLYKNNFLCRKEKDMIEYNNMLYKKIYTLLLKNDHYNDDIISSLIYVFDKKNIKYSLNNIKLDVFQENDFIHSIDLNIYMSLKYIDRHINDLFIPVMFYHYFLNDDKLTVLMTKFNETGQSDITDIQQFRAYLKNLMDDYIYGIYLIYSYVYENRKYIQRT